MADKMRSIVFACAIAGTPGAQATADADSLPIYDIDAACSAYVMQLEANSAKDAEAAEQPRKIKIKDCVLAEQRAYDILTAEWNALLPVTKTPCLLEATKHMRTGSYYDALNLCIQSRIQYDMFPGGQGL